MLIALSCWYGGLSLLSFIFYARDKSAARRHDSRTPETTLHLLAIAGGWPGAWVAQKLLRHKSIKPAFQFVFWLTMLLNCALLWIFIKFLPDLMG